MRKLFALGLVIGLLISIPCYARDALEGPTTVNHNTLWDGSSWVTQSGTSDGVPLTVGYNGTDWESKRLVASTETVQGYLENGAYLTIKPFNNLRWRILGYSIGSSRGGLYRLTDGATEVTVIGNVYLATDSTVVVPMLANGYYGTQPNVIGVLNRSGGPGYVALNIWGCKE